jgi:hypothetical protein
MTANFNLNKILAEPPKLHERNGQLISDYRIDKTTCRELNDRLKPGMKTLETGAGLSTIIFAANGCQHTCIMPDNELADRIQAYCRSASIDTSNVRFIISKSCDVIHQMDRAAYEITLIDGCHGFPSVFVDFYYAAKALTLGGTLVIDDMHIYTCHLVACFMQSDPGWSVELMNKRVAFGVKVSDTIDNGWMDQPFVMQRSRPKISFATPVLAAKATVNTLRTHGVRETVKSILGKVFPG